MKYNDGCVGYQIDGQVSISMLFLDGHSINCDNTLLIDPDAALKKTDKKVKTTLIKH